jgi:hypothetical protein
VGRHCPRHGSRFRAGHRSGTCRARFPGFLHHEIQWSGDGALDQPVHHRGIWRPAVGGCE